MRSREKNVTADFVLVSSLSKGNGHGGGRNATVLQRLDSGYKWSQTIT